MVDGLRERGHAFVYMAEQDAGVGDASVLAITRENPRLRAAV
jgi:hypothetical protein